jgi:YVTN family beta-propeller protein
MPLPIIAGLAAAVLSAGAVPTYSLGGSIAGPDGGWDLLAVDPEAHRLYVARSTGVMAVDLPTGKVSAGLVPLTRGHGVLPIPGTSRVIATSGGTGQAILFEGATGQVAATLAVGKNPDAVAYDPATKTVWVMNPGSGDISVVDPVAAKVVDTVSVPGGLELGAADGQGRLYVNIEDKNEVAVIDTRARKLLSRFPLKGCDGPTGIVYSAKAREIVSACGNGVAVVSSPDGAVYDPARDLAFVPSGGDGTLSVISLGAAPQVVATVATAKGARTAALDPSTGRIYLPSAKYAAAVGNARPAMLPGSFAVLVVSPGAGQ